MSGSSRASRTLSRCVVTLDAGISIAWERNPDGSDPGHAHHAREEAEFRRRLDAQTPALEVLFDELEQAGRRFVPPKDPAFAEAPQTAHAGRIEAVEVELCAEPPLTDAELRALGERVAALLQPAC